jgi:molybdopterin-guanine dinucleotide biosynthesis protein A
LPERKARRYHRLRNLDEYITNHGRPKPEPDLEGAILAGGESRRMGRDKALLAIGDRTFLEAIRDALHPLVGRVRVVGREPAPGPALGNAQPDLRPGLGPLSGIHTALATAEAGRVVVVACDLPLVTTPFLRGLVQELSPELDAVVPCPGGEPVPVCAVYRTACLGRIEERLDRGDLVARDFARSLKARFLDDLDLARLDPSGRCLLNLNTPLDHENLRRILEAESKT